MRAAISLAIAALVGAESAAADPGDARVLTAPTAWLPRAGSAIATFGVDHRGDGIAVVGYGLGGLAAVELGADSDVRVCTDCSGRPDPRVLGRAAFRLGARQHAWFRGMPALVLGVRTTLGASGGGLHAPRVSHAYAVASRDLGVLRVHAGLDAIAARVDALAGPAALRPLAALEVHPSIYPRSSLLGDLAWEPTLDARRGPRLGWLLGIGVRYQAFRWASVELAVRAREAEALGASTVLVRLNVVRDLAPHR